MMNQQALDYNKLRKEAQIRWLKPSEILYILQNHEKYRVSLEAPQIPPSGSLLLINRRVVRFFRKDGHIWRKKRGGKNVGEAHERLKVGNVDTLNCYYAHGEQNPYFQRRSYWMLDRAYEHIVLVHYREVSEGRFLLYGSSLNLCADSTSNSTVSQSNGISDVYHQGNTSGSGDLYDTTRRSYSPGTIEEVSSKFFIGKSDELRIHDPSSQTDVNQALRKLAEQLSLDAEDGSTIYNEEKLPAFSVEGEQSLDLSILECKTGESFQESQEYLFRNMETWEHSQVEAGKQNSSSQLTEVSCYSDKCGGQSESGGSSYCVQRQCPTWSDMLDSAGISSRGKSSDLCPNVLDSSISNFSPNILDSSISKLSAPGAQSSTRCMLNHSMASSEVEKNPGASYQHSGQFTPQLDLGKIKSVTSSIGYHSPESDLSLQLSATRDFLLGPETPINSPASTSQFAEAHMQNSSENNIHESCRDMVKQRRENSTEWMGNFDLDVQDDMYSSDISSLFFDQDQFGFPIGDDSSLTVAAKQRFSIREISPEWAFSFESTKVIITGDFLCSSSECPWSVMFGDIEVPAKIIQEGVLLCLTPQHSVGKVALCVTSGNRESCSEVRDFEFRAKYAASSFTCSSPEAGSIYNSEELLLLVKLVRMLLYGSEGGIALKPEYSRASEEEGRWLEITEALLIGSEVPSGTLNWIMQQLVKDKLCHWLSSKNQHGDCLLSKQEQSIIHMISGLGYEWALKPILDSGVGINFRDANGWTALHWAARFGREEMVAALLATGASAVAVTDPTPVDRVGKTAGAIAAACGHGGIAGYLSEADLTSHLSSLTMEREERAVESISERSVQMHAGGTEDELSLKDTLAAVRNATQAAARIQTAFRAHSFRKRQQLVSHSQDDYGMSPSGIHRLSASPLFQRAVRGSRDQAFDKAALSIQKKYKGWKGRNDFLTLRQHVVKIQAHVRGHQERKKYKAFVGIVGVLEKVVLRWRRKGVGLRGYRAEPEEIDEGAEEVEDIVKVFRKQKVDDAIEQAMSRVLNMVESPTARNQYRRMLERFRQAKAENCNGLPEESTFRLQDDYEIIESTELLY